MSLDELKALLRDNGVEFFVQRETGNLATIRVWVPSLGAENVK
jgi:hypothetical protein